MSTAQKSFSHIVWKSHEGWSWQMVFLWAVKDGLGSPGLKVKEKRNVLSPDLLFCTSRSVNSWAFPIKFPRSKSWLMESMAELLSAEAHLKVDPWVEVPLLLCFRSPVYRWRRCKSLCHPHSWNVMHAVHRVCFKREAEGGGGEEGSPLWKRQGAQGLGARGGVYYYSFMKTMKQKTHFPTPSAPLKKKHLLH